MRSYFKRKNQGTVTNRSKQNPNPAIKRLVFDVWNSPFSGPQMACAVTPLQLCHPQQRCLVLQTRASSWVGPSSSLSLPTSRGLCSKGSFTSTQRHFCWETLTLTHNANPPLPSTTHSCLLNQYHEGDYPRHSHARCLLEGQPWPTWTPAPEEMVSYFTADSSAPDNPPWLIQESKSFTSTDY